jgi:hypothetical protein
MFEVRQLLYGDPERQSASFVIMSRKTHENAESYINNAMFLTFIPRHAIAPVHIRTALDGTLPHEGTGV